MTNWSDYLSADFDTGMLTWKRRPREHFASERAWKAWNTRFAGLSAGGPHNQGYKQVRIGGYPGLAHRIIYEMANGPIASGLQIDHIDGNRTNNSLSNLRIATNAENMCNRGKNANNTSGFKGVCLNKPTGSWKAGIKVHGRRKHIGYFSTPEAAHRAYCEHAAILHGSFAFIEVEASGNFIAHNHRIIDGKVR